MTGNYEVRISRLFLVALIAVGLIFLAVGVDIGFGHWIFDEALESGNELPKLLFAIFLILIGSVIVASQTFFLIIPPLMLRVTTDFVSFGTGFLYSQFKIPANKMISVDVFTGASDMEIMGKRKIAVKGVELRFSRDESVPKSMGTSAGVTFSDYTLRLHKPYISKRPDRIVSEIRRLVEK